MILEWFEYLATPASTEAKKWGHLKQSIALRARASRQQMAWKSHLESCHSVVEHLMKKEAGVTGTARSLMILGSGHLFDIPKSIFDETINPHLNKIILVDLVHPLEIRKRAQSDSRLHLIEMDLSGGVPQDRSLSSLSRHFNDLSIPDLPTTDLVISANIMSQLPLPLVKTVFETQANLGAADATDLDQIKVRIETAICQNHWRLLTQFSQRGSKVLFWTDVEKLFFDGEGELLHQESSLGEFSIPLKTQKWIWDIAPIPEISKKFALQMKIQCGQID